MAEFLAAVVVRTVDAGSVGRWQTGACGFLPVAAAECGQAKGGAGPTA